MLRYIRKYERFQSCEIYDKSTRLYCVLEYEVNLTNKTI
jgi:hypothetical protein